LLAKQRSPVDCFDMLLLITFSYFGLALCSSIKDQKYHEEKRQYYKPLPDQQDHHGHYPSYYDRSAPHDYSNSLYDQPPHHEHSNSYYGRPSHHEYSNSYYDQPPYPYKDVYPDPIHENTIDHDEKLEDDEVYNPYLKQFDQWKTFENDNYTYDAARDRYYEEYDDDFYMFKPSVSPNPAYVTSSDEMDNDNYYPQSDTFTGGRHGRNSNLKYNEDLSDYDRFMSDCYNRKFASADKAYWSHQDEEKRTMRLYGGDDFNSSPEYPLLQYDQRNNYTTIIPFQYHTLRATPHGRHLLMVTLLENMDADYWSDRCEGLVSLYLPDSLKSSYQPRVPRDACLLEEVRTNGDLWTRNDILAVYDNLVASSVRKDSYFSRFLIDHTRALKSLVKFAMWLPSFDSMYSVMVVLRDTCNKRLYTEAVMTIIQARDDLGFVIPSLFSILPENFLPQRFLNQGYYHDEYYSQNRHGRKDGWHISGRLPPKRLREHSQRPQHPKEHPWRPQHPKDHSQQRSEHSTEHRQQGPEHARQHPQQPPVDRQHPRERPHEHPQEHPQIPERKPGHGNEVISFRTTHSNLAPNDPERHMWHMREDPLYQTSHWTWHVLLTDGGADILMTRRGEMFFQMHRQMLNRYNGDRLSVGLKPVKPYTPQQWQEPGLEGYRVDNLLEGTGNRPAGSIMNGTWAAVLRSARDNLMDAVRNGFIGDRRLGYVDGVDVGISPLGDNVEAFGNTTLGNYHNNGHVAIAEMTEDDGFGVMGNTLNAPRDIAFFRWHQNIDRVFHTYKGQLGAYSSHELDFPGVTVTSISVSPQQNGANAVHRGYMNRLRTYVFVDHLELNPDYLATQGANMVRYERVTHDPFEYNIRIESTVYGYGIGRIFLFPEMNHFEHMDMYNFAIEMDKFLIHLTPGSQTITRTTAQSPIFSVGPPSLNDLQNKLLRGMSESDFNWANCGYPISMAVPRGSKHGMKFRLVLLITQLLPQDREKIEDWQNSQRTAWGWCGLRGGDGSIPDSRPMGFPFDRPTRYRDIVTDHRSNVHETVITITHHG